MREKWKLSYQYIVVLNDDYEGKPIHHSYIYSLTHSTEITPQAYHKGILGEGLTKVFNAREFKNLNFQQVNEIIEIIEEPAKIRPYTFMNFVPLKNI